MDNVNTALAEHKREEKETTIDFVPDKKGISDETKTLIIHAIPSVVSLIFDIVFLER